MHRKIVIAALLGLPMAASAQVLRGTVTDSASHTAIPGTVVMLLDSAGTTIGRTITNERGEYRIAAPFSARNLRVLRLGFRARRIPVTPSLNREVRLDITMVTIPTVLEGVRVVSDPRCPRRGNEAATFALLDQVRAGLLTAVVARETDSAATLVKLTYERTFDGTTERIDRQQVRIDSTKGITRSFTSARTAWQFVHYGFVRDSAESLIYYGPDAEALLDEAFNEGYCFQIRNGDRGARSNQMGLAFSPLNRREGRVDIDGTLWVDTTARALRDIEYRYVGLPSEANPVRPGGRISFREMPNGAVLIHRWYFRLPVALSDTTFHGDTSRVIRPTLNARETGGEVASVTWPDGTVWNNALGQLRMRVMSNDGRPLVGAVVRLVDTDYTAAADSLGDVRIRHLLPGPYAASLVHPELVALGITLPTNVRFVANRDSVFWSNAIVPPLATYVRPGCTGTAEGEESPPWLFANVEAAKLQPVSNANWVLSKRTGPNQRITERRRTDAEGRIHTCLALGEGDLLEVRVWRDGEPPRASFISILGRRTSITMILPSKTP